MASNNQSPKKQDTARSAEISNQNIPKIEPGLCLKERYRLEELAGEGGMGKVFRATDLKECHRVAVKHVLALPGTSQAEILERFKREYHFLSSIDHPNIVKALDFFEENGQPFLVLEFAKGMSLKALIESKPKSLSLAEQLAIGNQISRAIEIVNLAGILHRDIKPANIVVNVETCKVKLLDLGLGKSLDNKSRLTCAGSILGTTEYLSPEQVNGGISSRSDIFCLGITLYQFFLWFPQSPFKSARAISTMNCILETELPPLYEQISWSYSKEEGEAYRTISEILSKALEKDPGKRLASAGLMAETLERLYQKLTHRVSDKKEKWNLTMAVDSSLLQKLEVLSQKYGKEEVFHSRHDRHERHDKQEKQSKQDSQDKQDRQEKQEKQSGKTSKRVKSKAVRRNTKQWLIAGWLFIVFIGILALILHSSKRQQLNDAGQSEAVPIDLVKMSEKIIEKAKPPEKNIPTENQEKPATSKEPGKIEETKPKTDEKATEIEEPINTQEEDREEARLQKEIDAEKKNTPESFAKTPKKLSLLDLEKGLQEVQGKKYKKLIDKTKSKTKLEEYNLHLSRLERERLANEQGRLALALEKAKQENNANKADEYRLQIANICEKLADIEELQYYIHSIKNKTPEMLLKAIQSADNGGLDLTSLYQRRLFTSLFPNHPQTKDFNKEILSLETKIEEGFYNLSEKRRNIRKVLLGIGCAKASCWDLKDPYTKKKFFQAQQTIKKSLPDLLPWSHVIEALLWIKQKEFASAEKSLKIKPPQKFDCPYISLYQGQYIWPEVEFVQGVLYFATKKYDLASKSFKTIQEKWNSYPGGFNFLAAETCMYTGITPSHKEWEENIQTHLVSLVNILGVRAIANNEIIITQDREEGIANYEDILWLETFKHMVHYKLAYRLWQTNRVSEAEDHLNKAKMLSPDFSEATFLLGEVYYATRRLQKARECFLYCTVFPLKWEPWMAEKSRERLKAIGN